MESPKNDYIRRVERILYTYLSLKAAVANEAEVMPSITAYYGERSGSGTGTVSKPTEKFAIMRAEKAMQLQQIERALAAITVMERELVVHKFFDAAMPSDSVVYSSMGLGSTAYYKLKGQALRKLALSLNII